MKGNKKELKKDLEKRQKVINDFIYQTTDILNDLGIGVIYDKKGKKKGNILVPLLILSIVGYIKKNIEKKQKDKRGLIDSNKENEK